ncbi:uncharacterized protein [Heterodontus francisci]|uniref:uncharacterized protein n=1 Tax=Heterodontus francisci TaxID=7792 RepID=UPI00355B13A9
MKPMGPTVLAFALLNVIDAYQSTSVENTAVQNGLPITNKMGSALTGFMKQRFRRELNCGPGQYNTVDSKRCCKKCQAGTHLVKECTDNLETTCKSCPEGEFIDAENHLNNCLRCKRCQEQDGLEMKTSCNGTHDATCTCRKTFFCLHPESCSRCISCKKCNEETEEIEQPCTEVKNTVCTAKERKSWIAGVVVAVIIALAIILCVVLYFKRGVLPCMPKSKVEVDEPLDPINDDKQPSPQVVPGTVCSQMQPVHVIFFIFPFWNQLGLYPFKCIVNSVTFYVQTADLILRLFPLNQRRFNRGMRSSLQELLANWRAGSSSVPAAPLGAVATAGTAQPEKQHGRHLQSKVSEVGVTGASNAGRDLELSEEHLHLIVEEIEPRIYHELGIKLGHTEPKLQQIEADHRDDIKRQGYDILYYWLQGNGKKGAFPALIDTLRKAGYITTTENIMRKMFAAGEGKLDANENGSAAV